MKRSSSHGFTLIELSIALVIIALMVGGVLTGKDLIEASKIRAQVKQFDQMFTAVNTFKMKYTMLPGDLTETIASQTGLTTGRYNNGYQTHGDGRIGTIAFAAGSSFSGEGLLYWNDLMRAGLINDTTHNPDDTYLYANMTSGFDRYVPRAKLNNQYLLVFSNGTNHERCTIRYYCMSIYNITSTNGGANFNADGAGLTALQAFHLDSKIDDGNPSSGKIWGNTGTNAFWAFVATPGGSCVANSATRYDITSTAMCLINIVP